MIITHVHIDHVGRLPALVAAGYRGPIWCSEASAKLLPVVIAPGRAAAGAGVLKPGREIVGVDPRYFRPAEVELVLGDPSKVKRELGWEPKVKFRELVEMMVDADTSCVPQRHGADARNATTVAGQMREKYLQDGGLVTILRIVARPCVRAMK